MKHSKWQNFPSGGGTQFLTDRKSKSNKKNSLLSLALVALLIAVAVMGGVFAYLTSEDSDVNVMTIGNVQIAQHEYERSIDADGSYVKVISDSGEGYKLQEFTQQKPLYPAVGTVTGWDETTVYFDQLGSQASGQQNLLVGLNNVQDKLVLVENTGISDAYIRTIIAFEIGNKTDAFGSLILTNDNPSWTKRNVGPAVIQGNQYYLVEYIYNRIVPAGAFTENSLAQIYMSSAVTNADVKDIDGNENGTFDVLVLSQAVQAAGFDDAKSALDQAFGPADASNGEEWFDDFDIPDGQPEGPYYIHSYQEAYDVFSKPDVTGILMNSLDGDGTVEMTHVGTFSCEGYTITAESGTPAEPALLTKGGRITDLNLEYDTRTKSGIGSTTEKPIIADLYLEAVNLLAANRNVNTPVYALQGVIENGASIYVDSSGLEGSVSLKGDLAKLSFSNSTFRNEDDTTGRKYQLELYSDTDFTGCDFISSRNNPIHIVPVQDDEKSTIRLQDCTYNGEPMMVEDVKDLLLDVDTYGEDAYRNCYTIIVNDETLVI